jgi:arabinosaccharide transport system substrate-binding protein
MSNKALSRRDFLRSAAVFAAGTMLASCAPSPTPTQAPQAEEPKQAPVTDQKQPVTLSMWTHDNLYVQFYNKCGEVWKANYPQYEITFNFQQLPDVFTKMLASLAAGEEVPDLFGLEQGWFGSYTKDDVIDDKFLDITPLIASERDKFVENTWTKYTYKGKTYGVESALCTVGYYFQPAVLEKAGASELPKTWEDFMDLGIQAAKKGIFLSALDSEGGGVFDMLFMQRGGKYFDKDSNFVFGESANREMALEVMKFIKSGIDNQVFWPAGSDFWGAGLMAAHKEGKVMGLPAADWWSDSLLKTNAADQAGNWRISLLPKWKGGGHVSSVWGGTGFVVTKASKHADLAWDLIHYTYMTKENQIDRYFTIHYLPHMFEALDDPRFTDAKDSYYGEQQIGRVWSEAAKDMPLYYQSPVRGDLNTELGTQLTNMYAGSTTPEAAIDAVVAKVEQAIADL